MADYQVIILQVTLLVVDFRNEFSFGTLHLWNCNEEFLCAVSFR